MIIPKRIKLGNNIWVIKEIDKLGKNTCGYCDYKNKEICILKEHKDKKFTYTHELIHAFVWENTHNRELVEDEILTDFLTDLALRGRLKIK